jgi:hypothetical protein
VLLDEMLRVSTRSSSPSSQEDATSAACPIEPDDATDGSDEGVTDGSDEVEATFFGAPFRAYLWDSQP